MKLETYLNALEYAVVDYMSDHFMGSYAIRRRQGKAFRARILKMFEEKEDFIEWAHEALEYYYDEDLAQREQITEKDAKIAELDKRIDVLRAEYDFLLDKEAQDV